MLLKQHGEIWKDKHDVQLPGRVNQTHRCKMRTDQAGRDPGVPVDHKQDLSQDAAVKKANSTWIHINKHFLCKLLKVLTFF